MTESGAVTTGIIGATCCRIICRSYDLFVLMKLVIAATGASGTIYLQSLLEQIDCRAHEVHLVMSAHAQLVAKQELEDFKLPPSVSPHLENDLNVPFVSASARFDAMVLAPCSVA